MNVLIDKIRINKNIIFYIFLVLTALFLTSRFDKYIIGCDLGDIIEKKEYEKKYTQHEIYTYLKDFSLKENIITSTSNDPWILINTTDVINTIKYIKIDIEIINKDETIAQFYYAPIHSEFNENYSIKKKLKSGINYIRIPEEKFGSFRLDLTNNAGVSLSINSVELTNKYVPSLIKIFLLLLIFILYCGIGYLIIFKTSFLIRINCYFEKYKITKLEYLYLFISICIGLLYMFLITPLSVPDEPHHYHSSHLLSNYLMFQKDKTIANTSNFDYSYLAGHYNVSSAYNRLKDEKVYIVKTNEYQEIPKPYDINYFIYYLPQAIGISIAKILKLSFFGVFYLGRLFNLIFYILCVFLSIRLIKEFKLTIFFIGLLPMSLHQAASFSYDAFVNGISILFITYLIYILYEKKIMEQKDIIIMAILSALLAPAKIVYFPIILLIFLIIPYIYGLKEKKGYIISTIIIFAGLLTLLIFSLNSIKNTLNSNDLLNWEGKHNYTLSFVISNPIQTIKIFWNTILANRDFYFYGSFGGFLSGLTLHLPKYYIQFYIVIIVLSLFFKNKENWNPIWQQRLIYFIVIISVILLTMLSLFIGWTSNTSNYVLGVQGRYFTPLIPLLFLIIKNKYLKSINKYFYGYILIFIFIILQIYTLKYIYNYTMIN